MNDKIGLVTGASDGIGKATVRGLARAGTRVIMVCRSGERGEQARQEIMAETGNEKIDLLIADLGVQTDIRKLARELIQRYDRLDVLINNAATLPRRRQESVDGLEMQLAVNHLAYFLLTNLLLDLLRQSFSARIINVASEAHRGHKLDFDDLQAERQYRPTPVYGRTKLMNILFTYDLAQRLHGSQVTVNCLHPGAIATKLLGAFMGMPKSLKMINSVMFPGPEKGAVTTLYLAISPEVQGVSGKYFVDCREKQSSRESYNEGAADRLWSISAELTAASLY